MAEVAAIVLAAGRASRFGAGGDDSKAYALLGDKALVTHVAAAALGSRARPILVVTGQGAARADGVLAGLDVRLIHNPRYAEGMAGSIAAGLAHVPSSAEAVLILLADMPLVRAGTLDALIAAYEGDRPDAVVPCHGGRRGNPVLIGRSLFPSLTTLRGDEGARRILAQQGRRIASIEVDDPGILVDVDTPEALAALAAERQR